MKKFLKNVFALFDFLLSGKGEIADEFVRAGLIDYSGQGRDSFGK